MGIDHNYAWTFERDPDLQALQAQLHERKVGSMFCDVVDAENHTLESVDALFAGFPCQAFSAAGKSKGVRDPEKGIVILSILKILQILSTHPRLIVMENVTGLVRDHKPVVAFVKHVLERFSYSVRIWILNSVQHGVPQHRPRVWIIAVRSDCMRETPHIPKPLIFLASLAQGFINMKEKCKAEKLPEGVEKKSVKQLNIEKGTSVARAQKIDLKKASNFDRRPSFSIFRCCSSGSLPMPYAVTWNPWWILHSALEPFHNLGRARVAHGHPAKSD